MSSRAPNRHRTWHRADEFAYTRNPSAPLFSGWNWVPISVPRSTAAASSRTVVGDGRSHPARGSPRTVDEIHVRARRMPSRSADARTVAMVFHPMCGTFTPRRRQLARPARAAARALAAVSFVAALEEQLMAEADAEHWPSRRATSRTASARPVSERRAATRTLRLRKDDAVAADDLLRVANDHGSGRRRGAHARRCADCGPVVANPDARHHSVLRRGHTPTDDEAASRVARPSALKAASAM